MSYVESIAEIGEMQKNYFDKLSSNLQIIERNIKNRGVVLTYEPIKKAKPLYCDIGIPRKIIERNWMPLEEICLVPLVDYQPDTCIDFNRISFKEGYTSVKGFFAERLWLDENRMPPVLTSSSIGVNSIYVDVSKELTKGNIYVPILFRDNAHKRLELSKKAFNTNEEHLACISPNTVIVEEEGITNVLKEINPRHVDDIEAYIEKISKR